MTRWTHSEIMYCSGCNSDSMSYLYQLHNAVTIPEVVEFKHKKKNGGRLMVVTLVSFLTNEAAIQTRPIESLINL